MAEPSINGTLVRQHLAVLRELHGAESVRRALDALAEPMRDQIVGASPVGWVPMQSFERFYEAVAAELGRDPAEVHVETARVSIERTFRTLWRVLLRFTSDAALVSRTPLFHSRGYNVGKLTAVIPRPGRAEAELSEWPDVPPIVRRGLRIGIETVLKLAGRENVTATDQATADGARFLVTWDA